MSTPLALANGGCHGGQDGSAYNPARHNAFRRILAQRPDAGDLGRPGRGRGTVGAIRGGLPGCPGEPGRRSPVPSPLPRDRLR